MSDGFTGIAKAAQQSVRLCVQSGVRRMQPGCRLDCGIVNRYFCCVATSKVLYKPMGRAKIPVNVSANIDYKSGA
jgi:hypothetical protein